MKALTILITEEEAEILEDAIITNIEQCEADIKRWKKFRPQRAKYMKWLIKKNKELLERLK